MCDLELDSVLEALGVLYDRGRDFKIRRLRATIGLRKDGSFPPPDEGENDNEDLEGWMDIDEDYPK